MRADRYAFLIFNARVKLAACAAMRHNPAWENFYWIMLDWAASSRRRAAALRAARNAEPREQVQLDLFDEPEENMR